MSVARPNFYDLNPLTVYESAYDTSQGYPFLTPSYENRVEVRFNSHHGFYVNLYYSHGKDQIDWITVCNLLNNTSTSPANIYKSDKTGLYINYNHRFSQWMNIIADGELFYYDAETYPVDYDYVGVEQAIRYAAILLDAADDRQEDYDELLIERNRKGRYWVHFAVRPPKEGNRRKVMFIQT